MPNRSSQRPKSLPERPARPWRRWLPASPARLAVVGLSLSVAIFAGLKLGNSAIADINPVHYRGAVLHPRDRGAAVPENRVRPAEPRYAALYGWDEGRAAIEAERQAAERQVAPAPVFAPPPRRRAVAAQTLDQPAGAGRFRASISDDQVRVHRYDYQSRDVYLPRRGEEDRGSAGDKPEAED